MFRNLFRRLGHAFRGLVRGVRMDRAFAEHLVCTSAVLLAGVVLRVNLVEACLLVLCVGGVVTAEMFNTAIEQLAKTIPPAQPSAWLGARLIRRSRLARVRQCCTRGLHHLRLSPGNHAPLVFAGRVILSNCSAVFAGSSFSRRPQRRPTLELRNSIECFSRTRST